MLRAGSALALVALAASAQTLNCRVLAHVDKFPGAIQPNNNYTGCWGMVASNGKEYAFVGARTGTIVYDASVPSAPVEVAFIPGGAPLSGHYFWREIQSLADKVYVASEHGPLQVIDMATPTTPTLASTFGGTAHSLGIDQGAKLLWACGGIGVGALIYDLGQSVLNPPQIGAYTATYVHDVFAARGFAYLSLSNDGVLRILDASKPTQLKVLSSTQTPGRFTHGSWVNADDTLMVVTDENPGGCLTVYDITNKSAPVKRGTWCSPNVATAHYVYLIGNVVHLACYSDGYWAIDISDPGNPTPIAHFDTSSLTTNAYVGAWGCYPFSPSGVVYVSDMQTGFWIVEPTAGVPRFYGNATPGTGGRVPRIDYTGGYARVGNQTFTITGKKLLGSTLAALVIGSAPTNVNVLGFDLLIDVSKPNEIVSLTTTAEGEGLVGLPLPLLPGIANAELWFQWLVLDAGSVGGTIAASRGMRIVVAQ